jgi:hypothetical protein
MGLSETLMKMTVEVSENSRRIFDNFIEGAHQQFGARVSLTGIRFERDSDIPVRAKMEPIN